MVDAPYFKGMPASQDIVPPNAFEIRTNELKDHIAGWQKIYDKLPDKDTPYAHQVQFRIDDMKQELKDFDEIGELPFTFYAAKDSDDAQYFSDQFPDGKVHPVKITARNLATVEDLRSLGFSGKQSVSHLTPMMVHRLKKHGFDGAIGTIDQRNGEEVVVFSPQQIKAGEVTESAERTFQDELDELVRELKAKHGLKHLWIFDNGNNQIELSAIMVDKAEQKQGRGSAAMEDLVAYADAHGLTIILTPGVKDPHQGTSSRGRLVKFYKRFGFIENKGRNIDFAIGGGKMVRYPQ